MGCNNVTEVEKKCLVGMLNNNDSLYCWLYPNPSNGVIRISCNEKTKIQEITVYDLLGKKVFSTNAELRTMDLSSLPKGYYFVNIILDNSMKVEKVLIR